MQATAAPPLQAWLHQNNTHPSLLAGLPPKVEGWLENAVEGGPPVKYDFSRKRPRSEDGNGSN
jgi:hypothetical protein